MTLQLKTMGLVIVLCVAGLACTSDKGAVEESTVSKVSPQETSGQKEAAIATLTEARELFDKAVAAQGGWGSTQDLLKDADVSVASGDYQKALDLADKAKREASLSYAQAQHEQKNWSEPAFLQ